MSVLSAAMAAAFAAAIQPAAAAPPPQAPPTEFIEAVAAPSANGQLALWRDSVCVGVANLQADAAQVMADRISDWASSLGLQVGEPGCRPNIVVVASDDGNAMARQLVASRPREFRTGATGADQGAAALRAFQNSGRPVRWWHVSLPVDEDTGAPVGRLPGQMPKELTGRELRRVTDFGVNTAIVSTSRLTSEVRQDLQQVIVVFDMAAMDTATFGQLTDYVALVALAPIDPDAQTRAFPTLLNLFEDSAPTAEALTPWDRAFLRGLYEAEQDSPNSGVNMSAVGAAMHRELNPNP